jgi:hypothetical protein
MPTTTSTSWSSWRAPEARGCAGASPLLSWAYLDVLRASGLDHPRIAVFATQPGARLNLVATGRFLTIMTISVLRFSKSPEIAILPVKPRARAGRDYHPEEPHAQPRRATFRRDRPRSCEASGTKKMVDIHASSGPERPVNAAPRNHPIPVLLSPPSHTIEPQCGGTLAFVSVPNHPQTFEPQPYQTSLNRKSFTREVVFSALDPRSRRALACAL